MTKKDYCKFAEMVKYNRANTGTGTDTDEAFAGYRVACNDFAFAMADIFAADNPRFDREQFLKACGIK